MIIALNAYYTLDLLQDSMKELMLHLKDGGEIVIAYTAIIPMNFQEALYETIKKNKWAPFFNTSHPHYHKAWKNFCSFLTKQHLSLIKNSPLPFTYVFLNKNELKDFLQTALCEITKLPKEMRESFSLDLIEEYLHLYPQVMSPEGRIFWRFDIENVRILLDNR